MEVIEKNKYTVIKSQEQYFEYCDLLESILEKDDDSLIEDIELLTVLIEKWNRENSSFKELDPIEILKSLMDDHNLKAVDIAKLLDLSEGTVSKMLNYKKGISKESIRILADYFKVSQEAFNRDYKLIEKTKIVRRYAVEALPVRAAKTVSSSYPVKHNTPKRSGSSKAKDQPIRGKRERSKE